MSPPRIKNIVSSGRLDRNENALDAPGRQKPDELFAALDPFEALGDDTNRPGESPDREALHPHLHCLPLETLCLKPS